MNMAAQINLNLLVKSWKKSNRTQHRKLVFSKGIYTVPKLSPIPTSISTVKNSRKILGMAVNNSRHEGQAIPRTSYVQLC
jgi:hypothetical protein